MITPPPVNAGTPHTAGESRHPVHPMRVLTGQFLVAIGNLIDVAAMGIGCVQSDVAEWLGTTLIRWAEQDRAEMKRRTTDK